MIYRGTIIGLFKARGGSVIALLGIEDDVKGKVLIPCDGNPACRAFDAVFPGTLRGGTFHNDGIQGERIYYELDEVGVLKSFVPVDRAPIEKIEEYAKQTSPPKKGKSTFGGFLPPDHPLYSSGPIVAGRPIQEKKPGRYVNHGFAKPDDPIYSTGPIVNGREIGKPYRKMTPEERERNFQIARDEIARRNQNPSENN